MTAALAEDAGCGPDLNLVFSKPVSGDAGRRPPKRKTKYDRRRERGRLAKLAKEEKKRRGQQQQQQQVRGQQGQGQWQRKHEKQQYHQQQHREREGGSSLAAAAAALGGGPSATTEDDNSATAAARGSAPLAEGATGEKDPAGANGPEKKAKDLGAECDADVDAGPKKEARPLMSKSSSCGEGEHPSSRATDVPKSTLASPSSMDDAYRIEDTMASSRRRRAQASLTEEQRIRYLSEFHARPRDLDRGERASRDIKASVASDHIFGHGDDHVDVDGDDDDDGNVPEGDTSETVVKSDKQMTGGGNNPFSKLGLHPNLVSALTSPDGKFRLERPTLVQSRSITALLPEISRSRKGNDGAGKKSGQKADGNLFIQSETGSGKTLAYLLPVLQGLAVDPSTRRPRRVDRRSGGTRAVILCPTRELATQTYAVANDLCAKSFPWIVPGCLSGGEKRKSEKARLRKGISILVATPGRLLDHLTKTESLLSALKGKLEWMVLDEADRLLDAGLGGQVEQIVQHVRSNQPGAGRKRDGVTWRSVLVSATVAKELEGLARTVLGGDGGWTWARGHGGGGRKTAGGSKPSENACDDDDAESVSADRAKSSGSLDNAAPRQLAQLYMVVPAKLRLSSLVAFLVARASDGERIVVFFSTCDSVDYHHALFTSMGCILGDKDEGESGIFGKSCPIHKLHGNVPHDRRRATLGLFDSGSSAILLATDVAARGLNLPALDWIVQYDPPCETKDYVHRAGRSARAGSAGHCLLFLLPSERAYVEVLGLRGLRGLSALSLSSTLTRAAEVCGGVAREGEVRVGGNNKFSDGRGEAFSLAVQDRLEQRVIRDDAEHRESMEKRFRGNDKRQRRAQRREAAGPLLEGARAALSAFVRAYPAKEAAVRHIFNARALHLGHVARSLALREAPRAAASRKGGWDDAVGGDEKRGGSSGKRRSRLAFDDGGRLAANGCGGADGGAGAVLEDGERERDLGQLGDAIGMDSGAGPMRKLSRPASKRPKPSWAARDSGGVGGRKEGDVRRKMMERAMMMQSQEFM